MSIGPKETAASGTTSSSKKMGTAEPSSSSAAAAVSSRKPIPEIGAFILTRLTATSFLFAFLSVLMHFEAFWGCEGLLTHAANFPHSSLLKDLLCFVVVGAIGTALWIALAGDKSPGGWMANTPGVFLLFGLFYMLINYFGGADLYQRDYDWLLLEVTFVTFLMLQVRRQGAGGWPFCRQMCGFVLFRFLFTYTATALSSGCNSLWDSTWLSYAHELPEPSPLVFYLRFHSETLGRMASRCLSVIIFTSFLIGAPLTVVAQPSSSIREVAVSVTLLGTFIYFLALQSVTWTGLLLVALCCASSSSGTTLLMPYRLVYNWGCSAALGTEACAGGKGGKLSKIAEESAEDTAVKSSTGAATEGQTESSEDDLCDETDWLSIIACCGVIGAGAFAIGEPSINFESLVPSYGEGQKRNLLDL